MTIAELRLEITKEIEKLPESILPEILSVLQRLQVESTDKARRERSFRQILEEDGELLRRLAQYDSEL